MFLRILKRDLTDKPALNITLFIFMIIASVCVFVATALIYIKLACSDKSYEACNTSDLVVAVYHDLSDSEGYQHKITDIIKGYPNITDVYRSEAVQCSGYVEFPKAGGDSPDVLDYFALPVPEERNIPYDLSDRRLTVPDGCAAISQNMRNAVHTDIGDKLYFTTQLGNVYEFTVSDIYKNPTADSVNIIYFSDNDMKEIFDQSPVTVDWYDCYADTGEEDYYDSVLKTGYGVMDEVNKDKENSLALINIQKQLFLSNDGVISIIISIALMFISIFMVMLIMLTIHFSLKSAVKRDEREIGAMKAIGVYSLSYKVIFAAKYFAFAVGGGLIAIPISLPLEKIMVNQFLFHTLLPPQSMTAAISAAALTVLVLIIVGFIFIALSRMDRISVMDAIHGENRGERFGRASRLMLNKSPAGVPLFIALQSIFIKLKRYIGLIFAYSLGICMMLVIVRMKDSVVSEEYIKQYWVMGNMDFCYEISDDYRNMIAQKAGSFQSVSSLITEHLAENGIDVEIINEKFQGNINVEYKGESFQGTMSFGIPDTNELTIAKGGKAPILANEAAVSYYHAVQRGISLGDTITVEYDRYDPETVSTETVREDFIVTGFFEYPGVNMIRIFMGQEFSGASSEATEAFSRRLLCPQNEYEAYLAKMNECYPNGEVKFYGRDQVFSRMAGEGIETTFDIIIRATAVITAVIIILLTILYQNIFIEEETADIALMKSMGFDNRDIKLCQFLRMFILIIASVIISMITIVPAQALLSFIITQILTVVHFNVVVRAVKNFVIIPLCAVAIVSLAIMPALAPVKGIQIWRVRNE